MKKKTICSLSFSLMVLCAASLHAAKIYFVDGNNGRDSYNGVQSKPWKTIQKAADTMLAGDIVHVAAAVYPERIIVNSSGSDGALIYFLANGTVECQGFTIKGNYIRVGGFTVTGDQPTWNPEGYGIWVEGNFCTIDDNYAYHSQRGGIILTSQSANCVIRNNRCFRNGMEGMEINGTSHLVENNDVWGSLFIPPQDRPDTTGADGIRFFGSGHVFRGNYIHDINYKDPENTDYDYGIAAFHTWTDQWHVSASNILFEKNLIYLPDYKDAQATCHGFMLADCRDITIRNNIVIAHGGTGTGEGNVDHVRIINNTFIGSLLYLRSNWPVGISLQNCPNSTVKNNIIYDQANWSIYLEGTTYTDLEIGNNCIYNSDGTIPLGAVYPYDLWGVNPLFVNANNLNFHLRKGSPCIDAGTTLSDVWDDYDYYPRPSGAAFDIGAFEYYQMTTPTVSTTEVTSITSTGAASGGNVISDGGAPVKERGICWSTLANPTTADSKKTSGARTGSFISHMTGLIPITLYHVRSYATNSVGTAYGSDLSFTTLFARLRR